MAETREVIRKFDSAVESYLAEQRNIGLSPETVGNYSRRLKRFRDFWVETNPTADPSAEDVRNYRDQLLADGLSKKTVKQYLVELKGFFTFACDDDFEIYKKNPVSKRMYPKLTDADDKIYEKILSTDDIVKLWKNAKPKDYTLEKWARNYAIIVLLLDAKIRNKELLDLKVSDIDFDYNEIEVRNGKGNKRRWVTLSDISITAIKLYLESKIRPDYCTDDDYLFGTTASHAYGNAARKNIEWHRGTRQWLSQLVDKHIYQVTGKDGFMSHSLRHNGAILDLNTGVSDRRLQAELGHASITTTEIYSGRLQSVRKSRDYKAVIEERNKCAAENAGMLAG